MGSEFFHSFFTTKKSDLLYSCNVCNEHTFILSFHSFIFDIVLITELYGNFRVRSFLVYFDFVSAMKM